MQLPLYMTRCGGKNGLLVCKWGEGEGGWRASYGARGISRYLHTVHTHRTLTQVCMSQVIDTFAKQSKRKDSLTSLLTNFRGCSARKENIRLTPRNKAESRNSP
jgi:hypothetical protein